MLYVIIPLILSSLTSGQVFQLLHETQQDGEFINNSEIRPVNDIKSNLQRNFDQRAGQPFSMRSTQPVANHGSETAFSSQQTSASIDGTHFVNNQRLHFPGNNQGTENFSHASPSIHRTQSVNNHGQRINDKGQLLQRPIVGNTGPRSGQQLFNNQRLHFPVNNQGTENFNPREAELQLTSALISSNSSTTVRVNNFRDGNRCTTPDGNIGECGSVINCEPYLRYLRIIGHPTILNFFRQRICRVSQTTIHVCCPISSKDNKQIDQNQAQVQTQDPLHSVSRVCGTAPQGLTTDNRIVGGFAINSAGKWPWLAALGILHNNEFLLVCGGTLITGRHVLTAAHCFVVNEFQLPPTHLRLGEHNLHLPDQLDGGFVQEFNIEFARRRTYGYNGFTRENDIELVVLPRQVQFNEFVRPACLPIDHSIRNRNFEGEKLIVTGWGFTVFNSSVPRTSNVPMQVNVPVTSLEQCARAYRDDSVDMRNICAGEQGRDSCVGDSGGPLNYLNEDNRYYVVGISSFGNGCGLAGFPGVYTRVAYFINWIVNNLDV